MARRPVDWFHNLTSQRPKLCNPFNLQRTPKREQSIDEMGCGFPLNITKHVGGLSVSHQSGTVRFGKDPARAALDPYCRSFDHRNLSVVDPSFFPSSAAVNPALTIAAQALRVADHMAQVDLRVNGVKASEPAQANPASVS
jgi:choline dehydrogenase-like flavoprotein